MKNIENNIETVLAQFLAQFPDLSEEAAAAIATQLEVKFYPKGTVLQREGEISQLCFFILQGCLRQYRLMDGTEKTVQFFTEGQSAVIFSAYALAAPLDSNLVCLEDSILIAGNPTTESAMYQQFPQLAQITRSMMEQDFGRVQAEYAAFIASSPEERYLNLLATRPNLLQRVPQHQLASYLGVTPESLSRIRRRVGKR